MTHHPRCGGGTGRRGWVPRKTLMRAWQIGTAGGKRTAALAVVVLCTCLDVGFGFTDGISCPTELFACLGNGECSSCVDALQQAVETVEGDFELCSELYAAACALAESAGCDTENAELVEFLTCVAEDTYGCGDFTTCADFATESPATPAPVLATPAPINFTAPTAAGSTPAPSLSFPAPITPILVTLAPTAVPTAAPSPGSRATDPFTAYPSSSPTSGDYMDTMAPSAAPVVGGFPDTPTAAPTTGLEGAEDDVSGGSALTIASGRGRPAWLVVVVFASPFFAAFVSGLLATLAA